MAESQPRKVSSAPRKRGRSGEREKARPEPDIFALLGHLDELLAQAVERVRAQHTEGEAGPAFRGIYISEREVDRIIDIGPGGNAVGAGAVSEAALEHFRSIETIEAA
jgi:hypothetical protein